MTTIESPSTLAASLIELFPSFSEECDDEELESYHQVIQLLAPVVTALVKVAPERTTRNFCQLLNAMVSAGGEHENAASTCLLEHASQLKIRQLIRPFLSAEAKRQLR